MGEWLNIPGTNTYVKRDAIVSVKLFTDTFPATPRHYVRFEADGQSYDWFSSTDLTTTQNELTRFLGEEV